MKAHLATRTKLQLASSHVSLLEMDIRISERSNFKRYLCASKALRESDADPRPCEMTPSDKDDVLHAVDATTQILSDPEAVIDVLDYPFAEITMSDGLLIVRGERKT